MWVGTSVWVALDGLASPGVLFTQVEGMGGQKSMGRWREKCGEGPRLRFGLTLNCLFCCSRSTTADLTQEVPRGNNKSFFTTLFITSILHSLWNTCSNTLASH